VEAGSLTIADLIKVAETYALLAVTEALQFSLVKIGPRARCYSCATSLDRAPTSALRAATHPGLRSPNLASSTLRYAVARNPAPGGYAQPAD
jgi:hypothetical protein